MAAPTRHSTRGQTTAADTSTVVDDTAAPANDGIAKVPVEQQSATVAVDKKRKRPAGVESDPLVELNADGALVTLELPLEKWRGTATDPMDGVTKIRICKPFARHMRAAEQLRMNLESDTDYAMAIAQTLTECDEITFGRLSIPDFKRFVAVASYFMGK